MKKLAVLAVAVALVGFAPRDAAAQGSQSMSIGAVFPTLLGACTGGAIGYYFVTGPVATMVGAVAGGARSAIGGIPRRMPRARLPGARRCPSKGRCRPASS